MSGGVNCFIKSIVLRSMLIVGEWCRTVIIATSAIKKDGFRKLKEGKNE